MKKQLSTENLIRFANVNARSLNNKTAEFVDHILKKKIDICVVTETWLKDIDSVSIAALSPPGYFFKSFPRQSDRRGGGTGVMFSTCVNFKFINGEEKCSFEYSEWNCNVANSAIKIIVVYRTTNFCSSLQLPVLQTNGVSYNYCYLSKNVVCY